VRTDHTSGCLISLCTTNIEWNPDVLPNKTERIIPRVLFGVPTMFANSQKSHTDWSKSDDALALVQPSRTRDKEKQIGPERRVGKHEKKQRNRQTDRPTEMGCAEINDRVGSRIIDDSRKAYLLNDEHPATVSVTCFSHQQRRRQIFLTVGCTTRLQQAKQVVGWL